MRIGQGIDVHAFSDDPTRPLILGGVTVPGSPGLAGHSDADVVTHALIDAILGAACLGDLGRHFPETDVFAGARSLDLLARAVDLVGDAGWRVTSGDVTVLAQRPRLGGLLDEMADHLGAQLGVTVSVKATTTDHLGAIGRGEGIGASAVVLVEAL